MLRKFDLKLLQDANLIKDAKTIQWSIANIKNDSGIDMDGNIVSFLLYKASLAGVRTYDAFLAIDVEPKIVFQEYSKKIITSDIWDRLTKMLDTYSAEAFAVAILTNCPSDGRNDYTTPKSVSELALKILSIKDGEKVADIGTGTGSFIIKACKANNRASYTGYDLSTAAVDGALIRTSLLDADVEIRQGNALDENVVPLHFYDKTFSNYPWGLWLGFNESSVALNFEEKTGIPHNKIPSDWIFNIAVLNSLKESGKAVVLMTTGSNQNRSSEQIREFFVKNGFVEAVISLPQNLFSFTNIATDMLVLSRGNKSIRFVNAREICQNGQRQQKGRKQNEFSEADIEKIVKLLAEDGKESKLLSIEDVKNCNFNLSPAFYFADKIELENPERFGTVIKRITRGSNIKAGELDNISSAEPTKYQYVTLAHINNGILAEELPYIKEISETEKKYCLKRNNIIISKNILPLKVALVSDIGNREILASGNLFIIEIDEEKANPAYIQAFLSSRKGQAILNRIAKGTTIKFISIDDLQNMVISLPSREEQDRIANTYYAALDDIKIAKIRLTRALDKIASIMD